MALLFRFLCCPACRGGERWAPSQTIRRPPHKAVPQAGGQEARHRWKGALPKSNIESVRSNYERLAAAVLDLFRTQGLVTLYDLISFDHMASISFTTLSGIGT